MDANPIAWPRCCDGNAIDAIARPLAEIMDRLQTAKQNNLPRVLRGAAQRGAQHENQKTPGIESTPAEEVTQAADRDHRAD